MPAGVFAILPVNFFSLLASVNREHYAALLVLYYRLFQENSGGLERELLVREFMNYLALHRDTLADEGDESPGDEVPQARTQDGEAPAEGAAPAVGELFARAEEVAHNDQAPGPPADSREYAAKTVFRFTDERTLASRFLKRLINAGWLGEETLADFTKVINITAWGKPFMKALADIDGGLKTEYESHVVTVYSMLCGETIRKDGHHAVLKAHEECRSLIDSLKVLSQSIKGYYDNLNLETIRARAASALHEHYDLYMGEVLDKAYKRLKTSDNVSRYRQLIFKQVAELLADDKWLDESAAKYMRILQASRGQCRERLISMLDEIVEDLRAVDHLEDEIDRRNAAYSRSSTEIIKAYIEPDSTVAGKIGLLIKAILGGNEEAAARIAHGIHRIRFLSPSTLAFNQRREGGSFSAAASSADTEALDHSEEEFLLRMKKRLSIRKIGAWLDKQGGTRRVLVPEELVTGEDSYIRFVYALLYGDSRNNFSYIIEEDDDRAAASVQAADYVLPDIRFRKNSRARAAGETEETHEP
jgi:hypothetical protein